jgi:hypothetical protein
LVPNLHLPADGEADAYSGHSRARRHFVGYLDLASLNAVTDKIRAGRQGYGMMVDQFYHPEDRESMAGAVQRALAYGEPFDLAKICRGVVETQTSSHHLFPAD